MKVVIVGATGNAGTAVLRALHQTPEVTHIVGVARRLPDQNVEPYEGCEWHSLDIAAASTSEDAVSQLTEVFRGAEAVIHLAWLIQPNDQRELLRRVNVEGTRRVAEAVSRAGVPHLVAASSVGAYSPDEARSTDSDPPLRDESYPVGGIDSSHYSVDKAAQEKVLDTFAAGHPDITVTRLRPGLTFQADAASELQRYFLGKALPVQLLKSGRLPALTVPKGMLLQAVHADDVGRAYVAAVLRRLPGAFNICTDDVLGPQELADIVDHGRVLEVPPAMVRAALVAAHKSGLLPADAGWLDMAMQVPLMDNTRAIEELGWRPQVSSADALRELLDAMIEGHGHPSPPLHPRDKDERVVSAIHEPAKSGAHAGAGSATEGGTEDLPENLTKDLMGLYLSDHLTGATAGVNRIERMAADFIDTPVYADLASLADEIRADRELLRNIVEDLGFPRKPYRQAAAWAAERVGRLKLNGRIIERSPMTLLLEAELMRSAVAGKLGGWQTLREHAPELGLDREVFDRLIEATHRQLSTLDGVHEYARQRALRDDRDTFWD
ncbi:NAD-dependent epimerase/dehydratase family protein [Corynebacterium comes]|uniref:NAD dependent epimerase/dehydratase family protein n=1 Tax=Corynebacterium comes TaxID=2675218 RepID=A0A6B8VG38_9CORY|nr:NAD-dependent epimerase/dehydratase family protein [Corynebacterium comes]QGU04252.1 NAD dependent epimerase/dehydratase family protein [Corynebacterium comes]